LPSAAELLGLFPTGALRPSSEEGCAARDYVVALFARKTNHALQVGAEEGIKPETRSGQVNVDHRAFDKPHTDEVCAAETTARQLDPVELRTAQVRVRKSTRAISASNSVVFRRPSFSRSVRIRSVSSYSTAVLERVSQVANIAI